MHIHEALQLNTVKKDLLSAYLPIIRYHIAFKPYFTEHAGALCS